jgi:hypothetical protein
MAHIIHDSDQQFDSDSTGYNDSRSTGYNRPGIHKDAALFVVVIAFIMLFWVDLPRLRSSFNSAMIPEASDAGRRSHVGNGRVAVDNLNLRVNPNDDARIIYILPGGTRVTFLGESHKGVDGDVWLKVSVETFEGIQLGWVKQRYVV